MAKRLSLVPTMLKATIYLLMIAMTIGCAYSARTLAEEDATQPLPGVEPKEDETPFTPPAPAAVTPETPNLVTTPVADVAPTTGPAATQPSGGGGGGAAAGATSSVTVAQADPHQPLSFFMHDILGGSTPSGRVVAGLVANLGANGQLPFSKPNSAVFPINGGVPLLNGNNGIINNNNLPFLAGFGGATPSTVIQNTGNNNIVNGGNKLPFVTAGQLPAGSTLQKLMFGTVTVIDDELTEGHELGSSVVGKAQGFYLASSLDGSSQTMALTALFPSGDHEDTLSFFGVHRTAAPDSQITIVGGTGKYENARGYATIQTLHPTDQHTTDGVETLLQFSVYLSH